MHNAPLCANYPCHFPSAPIDACHEWLRNLHSPCWGTWRSLTQRLFHPTILHKLLKTKKKGKTSPIGASQTPSMLRNVVVPSCITLQAKHFHSPRYFSLRVPDPATAVTPDPSSIGVGWGSQTVWLIDGLIDTSYCRSMIKSTVARGWTHTASSYPLSLSSASRTWTRSYIWKNLSMQFVCKYSACIHDALQGKTTLKLIDRSSCLR